MFDKSSMNCRIDHRQLNYWSPKLNNSRSHKCCNKNCFPKTFKFSILNKCFNLKPNKFCILNYKPNTDFQLTTVLKHSSNTDWILIPCKFYNWDDRPNRKSHSSSNSCHKRDKWIDCWCCRLRIFHCRPNIAVFHWQLFRQCRRDSLKHMFICRDKRLSCKWDILQHHRWDRWNCISNKPSHCLKLWDNSHWHSWLNTGYLWNRVQNGKLYKHYKHCKSNNWRNKTGKCWLRDIWSCRKWDRRCC